MENKVYYRGDMNKVFSWRTGRPFIAVCNCLEYVRAGNILNFVTIFCLASIPDVNVPSWTTLHRLSRLIEILRYLKSIALCNYFFPLYLGSFLKLYCKPLTTHAHTYIHTYPQTKTKTNTQTHTFTCQIKTYCSLFQCWILTTSPYLLKPTRLPFPPSSLATVAHLAARHGCSRRLSITSSRALAWL